MHVFFVVVVVVVVVVVFGIAYWLPFNHSFTTNTMAKVSVVNYGYFIYLFIHLKKNIG